MSEAQTPDHSDASDGAVKPPVRWWLRLEGLAVALAVLWSYFILFRGDWRLLLVMALAPDLSFIAYVAGPRIGAIVYNLAHTYLVPAVLAAAGFYLWLPLLTHAALVWIIHIGADRALGYGLKYPDAFTSTHLGRIGRTSS